MESEDRVAAILREAIALREKRNAQYKDCWQLQSAVQSLLQNVAPFTARSVESEAAYNLWNMVLGKAVRLWVSGITQEDALRDIIVYAAMLLAHIQSTTESEDES